jgi:hypothetical protein
MNKDTINKLVLNVSIALIAALLTWVGSVFYNTQLQGKDFSHSIANISSKFDKFEAIIDKFGQKMEIDQKINDTKLNLLDKQLSLMELRLKTLEDRMASSK